MMQDPKQKILAYPGCPSLTYIIARRVTDTNAEDDATISIVGRKGIGKSTTGVELCTGISEDIARLRKRNEPPEKFFNIDNIKSVTELGALELLSSGALECENSVFLLDDAGTQWSARNFQSPINKTLNGILQVCRIYKCVIVSTFIMQSHVDVQARGMTDFRAQMLYKNTRTKQSLFKFFYLEQGEFRGKPKEYKKYLMWHGKRITKWVIDKPDSKIYQDYRTLRKDGTREYIDDAKRRVQEIIADRAKNGEEGAEKIKPDYTQKKEYTGLREKVLEIQNNPEISDKNKTPTAIARKLKTTRYRVELAGDF